MTEIEFAEENGYERIGSSEIPVDVPLSGEEIYKYSTQQTNALIEIRRLENELAAIRKSYKEKIKLQKEVVSSLTDISHGGVKTVDKVLPCFLDPSRGQKHWVDLDTGEVVKSAEVSEADMQKRLFD